MTPAELTAILSPTPLPLGATKIPSSGSSTPKNSSDPLADLRVALQNKDALAVEDLAKIIPIRLLNTTQVIKEVVENFDPKTAEPLFKNGLSVKALWSGEEWVGTPPVEFWPWLLKKHGDLTSSDLSMVWEKSWLVMMSNAPTSSPLRKTAAVARTLLAKLEPKMVSEEEVHAIFCRFQSLFSTDDWDSIRAWPKTVWSEESDVATWSQVNTAADAHALLKVVQEVPHAASALEAYQQKGLKLKQTIAQWFASPTGEIEDLPLVKLASAQNRADLVHAIKKGFDPCPIVSPSHAAHGEFLLGFFPQQAINLLPKSIQNTIDEYGEEYWVTSVFEMLVYSGAETLSHLPSTPVVERHLVEALNEPGLVMLMLNYNANPMELLQRFPALNTWKDEFGNSLCHWIAHSSETKVVNEALLSFMLKNEFSRQPNNAGITPMDVLVAANKTTPEQRAKYQKALVQQSLKEDTAVGSKLRSRSKTSGRKM